MPVEYDRPKVMAEICQEIATGKSLRWCCSQDGRPNITTIMDWVDQDETLRQQYVRARERQADYMADEAIEIADTEDDPAKARVRLDARKWAAGKMNPKKYGDKVSIGGDENAAPIRVLQTIERQIVRPKSSNPDG